MSEIMWTGYRRQHTHENIFSKYPTFVFIEHLKGTDAAEIFKIYFGHRPHEYGKSDWNSESDNRLLTLIGSVIDCSQEHSDCVDSFRLIYRFFTGKGKEYAKDMKKLNAFLKRDDVLFLSERDILK